MFTIYWIAIVICWVVGLWIWNKNYPKQKGGGS